MQKIFRSRGREQSANRRISFLERAVEKFQRTKLCILPLNSRNRQTSHNFLNLFLRRVDSPVVLSATNLPAGDEIQAIANAAGFHFAAIEQGGTNLYAAMALKASSLTVLQIIAGIGGAEVNHFAIWHDKAGNAPAVSFGGVTFPDLETFNGDESRQTNLIMPEPCTFIDSNLPECSVIRPGTTPNSGAVAAATAFTNSNLFMGQSPQFFATLNAPAQAADAARRIPEGPKK